MADDSAFYKCLDYYFIYLFIITTIWLRHHEAQRLLQLKYETQIRGATTAEKLRGPRFGSQHRALPPPRPAKGRAGCWVQEGVAPPAVRVRGYHGITSREFLKTQMLNTAFWWLYLLLNFLLLENYGREVGGRPIHCWSPNLKVGGPVSPGLYGCCADAWTIY